MKNGVDAQASRAEYDQDCNHTRGDSPFVLLRGDHGGTAARVPSVDNGWRIGRNFGAGHRGLAAGFRISLQPLQIRSHLGGALVPQIPVFLQRPIDDLFQLGRQIGIQSQRGTGARFRIASKIVAELSPRKGNCPVAIS